MAFCILAALITFNMGCLRPKIIKVPNETVVALKFKEKSDKIHLGMNKEEVDAILGKPDFVNDLSKSKDLYFSDVFELYTIGYWTSTGYFYYSDVHPSATKNYMITFNEQQKVTGKYIVTSSNGIAKVGILAIDRIYWENIFCERP